MGEIRLGESFCEHALICLRFSGLVAFLTTEKRETKNQIETGDREEQFIYLFFSSFSSSIFNEILWKMQILKKVSTYEIRKERYGKIMTDIKNDETLRIYYTYARNSDVLLQFGNVYISI